MQISVKNNKPFTIYLYITKLCNYNCYYCDAIKYSSDSIKQPNFIQLDMVFEFIIKFLLEKRQQIDLVFLGAEPTLHPDLLQFIEKIIEFNKKSPYQCNLILYTNLSQSTEYYINLIQNSVKIIASWHSKQDDKFNKSFISRCNQLLPFLTIVMFEKRHLIESIIAFNQIDSSRKILVPVDIDQYDTVDFLKFLKCKFPIQSELNKLLGCTVDGIDLQKLIFQYKNLTFKNKICGYISENFTIDTNGNIYGCDNMFSDNFKSSIKNAIANILTVDVTEFVQKLQPTICRCKTCSFLNFNVSKQSN